MSTTSSDPLGKKALFSPPVEDSGDDIVVDSRGPEGTDALFSAPAASERGAVIVTCSRCQNSTGVSVLDAVWRVAFFSVWMPFRSHDRWLTCPSCGHRAWCQLRWNS